MELSGLNGMGSPAPENPSEKSKQQDDLKEACQQFESLFLNQLLSSMRQTVMKSNIFGEDKESDMFNGMLDEERAKMWAHQGGLGLANILYQQMKGQL